MTSSEETALVSALRTAKGMSSLAVSHLRGTWKTQQVAEISATYRDYLVSILSTQWGLESLVALVNGHSLVRHCGRITIDQDNALDFQPYTQPEDKPCPPSQTS